MFKHFVITRFNLDYSAVPGYENYKLPDNPLEWLDNRFMIYEKHCLPSIINQTNRNFIWFVLFDINTPVKYREKIGTFEKELDFFKPLFLKDGNPVTIKDVLNTELKSYLDKTDRFVITSRIDNDDAFHESMIQDVQSLFKEKHNYFISSTYGLQYDVKKKVIARMHHENNHFISRVESLSEGIETVIFANHSNISKMAEVVYINEKKKPLWLEIIHGSNLINDLYVSSQPLFYFKFINLYHQELEISLRNTLNAFIHFAKLRFKIILSAWLKSK